MRDSAQVYILSNRVTSPIYHRRVGATKFTFCNQRLYSPEWVDLFEIVIRLGHARFFGRPCKFCWSAENAPRPVPISTHLAWRSALPV